VQPKTARRIWQRLEPLHATMYFAPEVTAAGKAIGLKGYWMGYFAGRGAPFGAAPAALIDATFFNFHPSLVHRAIPDAWGFASPETIWNTRLEALSTVLDSVVGPIAEGPELQALASELIDAAQAASPSGRPLFAATRSMPVPDAPALTLWHAATLVREHRGDGHIGVLTSEGFDGCEAHLSSVMGGAPREILQGTRAWSDEEWDAAADRLRSRGLLDDAGEPTAAGRESRATIEARTDELSLPLLGQLADPDGALELLAPVAKAVAGAAIVPFPNPMGVTEGS
jgi:Helix-turn-helix family